jgi:hypothetical protein
MLTSRKKISAGLALAFGAALVLSACSAGDTTTATPTEEPSMVEEEEMVEEPMMDPAANLVGPGCAAYAEAVPSGGGSIEGMSADPVAVAASNKTRS